MYLLLALKRRGPNIRHSVFCRPGLGPLGIGLRSWDESPFSSLGFLGEIGAVVLSALDAAND